MPQPAAQMIDRVQCPHCGAKNDFREIEYACEAGNVATCDDCGRHMKILKTLPTTLVWVLPSR